VTLHCLPLNQVLHLACTVQIQVGLGSGNPHALMKYCKIPLQVKKMYHQTIKYLKGNKMKKTIIVLSILLTTQLALAKAEATPTTKITYIYTYGTLAVIQIANATANTNGCNHPRAKTAMRINFNTTRGKEMYSAALLAFMSNIKVRIAHNGCKPWGTSTIPLAYRIDLAK